MLARHLHPPSHPSPNVTAGAPPDITAAIGGTPLMKLRRVTEGLPVGVEVWAKAEFLNPGGSVKDRPALAMIRAGEATGALTEDKILIDATSGNTGIAYAMICAALGYRAEICLPRNAGHERKRLLRSFGATLIETDPLLATDGAMLRAREIVAENPNRYFYPDQYNNPANWRAHFETTAPEIFDQTGGRVTHFVAGLGTTGTFTGVSRGLKRFNPAVRCLAMQPDSPLHGLEGMKHLETTVVPGIYDPTLADGIVEVSTEDAQAMTRRLAREEGLFVGVSSGGNVRAAIDVARDLPPGSVVVTVLCDAGSRYFGESFWDEP